jgi:hypothetical protein
LTGALSDALELIRSLKVQFPDETEDQLISRFLKEREGDQAFKRAVLRDVLNHLLRELGERKPPRRASSSMTGPELKVIRKSLGLTRSGFGQKLGCKGNKETLSIQIRRFESGARPIPEWIARQAMAIAKKEAH